jgi:hypothetical protein
MIYKIRYNADIFDDNPGLRAVEKFARLESVAMKFVCLVCDPSFDNPIRTQPERERREKAARLAGYPLEADGKRLNKNAREAIAGNKSWIEEAIAEFKSLHYDENQDLLESLNVQINEIRDFLKEKKGSDPKKLKAALELGAKLPELVKAKQDIESLLNVNSNQVPEFEPTTTVAEAISLPEEDSGDLSFADKVINNMRAGKTREE